MSRMQRFTDWQAEQTPSSDLFNPFRRPWHSLNDSWDMTHGEMEQERRRRRDRGNRGYCDEDMRNEGVREETPSPWLL